RSAAGAARRYSGKESGDAGRRQRQNLQSDADVSGGRRKRHGPGGEIFFHRSLRYGQDFSGQHGGDQRGGGEVSGVSRAFQGRGGARRGSRRPRLRHAAGDERRQIN